MERHEILEKLTDIVRFAVNNDSALPDEIDESLNLNTDLGLNSVGVIYIIIAIEENFDMRFENVSFGDFSTVGDVVDYIYDKKK